MLLWVEVGSLLKRMKIPNTDDPGKKEILQKEMEFERHSLHWIGRGDFVYLDWDLLRARSFGGSMKKKKEECSLLFG